AIRIPQATENPKLKRLVRAGIYEQENLLTRERAALSAIRAFDRREIGLEATLEAIMLYSEPLLREPGAKDEERAIASGLSTLRDRYARTLKDRPWSRCACPVCSSCSVEVIIFRASNRNKRRGIHNLSVFYQHVRSLKGGRHCAEHALVYSA